MSNSRMMRILGQALAAGLFLFSVGLAAADLQAAQVLELKGTAAIFNQQGMARAALKGGSVLGEEVVQTGQGSKLTLGFDDGSKLELGPNTRLKVNDQETSGSVSVFLFLGRLFARIVPMQSEEPAFAVQTLTTTAGVRGTDFEMAAGMDGGSLVSVETGAVELASDGGQDQLKAGEQAEVSYDGKLTKAKRGPMTDQQWQKWFQSREQFFTQHSDQVVNVLTRRIERSRALIAEQDRKMAAEKKILAALYEQGKLTPEQLRQEAAKQIRVYMKLITNLSQADNTLLAVNYIINNAEEQIKLNPDRFTPEFKSQIRSTLGKLKKMDIAALHKQDRQVIAVHFAGIMKSAKKWKLEGEVWRNLPAKTRQRIIQKWQEQKQGGSKGAPVPKQGAKEPPRRPAKAQEKK